MADPNGAPRLKDMRTALQEKGYTREEADTKTKGILHRRRRRRRTKQGK